MIYPCCVSSVLEQCRVVDDADDDIDTMVVLSFVFFSPSLLFVVAIVAFSGVEQRGSAGVEAHPVRRPRARSSKGNAGGEGGRGHGEASVEHACAR